MIFISFLAVVLCLLRVEVVHGLYSEYPQSVLKTEEVQKATDLMKEIPIRMTTKEVALFGRYLSKSTAYFEFGCGGSTIIACASAPPTMSVTSVDSSQQWIDIVTSNPHVSDRKKNNLLNMKVVDIGPVRVWGYPNQTVEESKGAWYMYSQAISMTDKQYDLVLVDGRFRVACLLNSLITNPKASVMIHDFYEASHYKAYKALLDVTEVVDRADTLVALRTKAHVRKEDLMKMYATYIHVPNRRP